MMTQTSRNIMRPKAKEEAGVELKTDKLIPGILDDKRSFVRTLVGHCGANIVGVEEH